MSPVLSFALHDRYIGKGREWKGMEGKGREGKGREGKGRERKGGVTQSIRRVTYLGLRI